MRLLYSHGRLQRARQHLIFLHFHKTETEKLQDQQLLENRAWVSSFLGFDVTDRLISMLLMFYVLCCCDKGQSFDIVIILTTASSLNELVIFSFRLCLVGLNILLANFL